MIRFHHALDIAREFGSSRLADYEPIYIVRDLVGRVSLALNISGERLESKSALSMELNESLGAYGPGAWESVQSRDDLLLPEEIFETQETICLQENPVVYLVDRLINNQDWLRPPLMEKPLMPLAAAFSLKGGVGRSTTFAAWAHHLAGQGYKVLAVDLDLEAPGLQSLLLRQDAGPRHDRRPDFGIVDWLVESRVSQADGMLFEDMLGSVELAPGVPGEIRVVPAFGRETRDYVAKLGRAYLPAVDEKGRECGLAEAIIGLLNMALQRAEPFDIALLDTRAGMHDIGAAAVTRLGAHAFFFARNDIQTWTAYEHLFEHLRWSPAVKWGMPNEDLRWRLSTVGAMADFSELEELRSRSYVTWQSLYDEETEASPDTPDEMDENMPHWPVPVYEVPELRGASFNDPDGAPPPEILQRAFHDFFSIAGQRVISDHAGEALW